MPEPLPGVRPITEADAASLFRCGKHPLDDYFARHAVANDRSGVSKAFVLPGRVEAGEPEVLGYYTLSMALLGSAEASSVLKSRLPRYPMPVALIGRLAVHEQTRGRGLGELLVGDAFDRVLALADQIGCLGIVVDAKDEDAERFYLKYAFTTVETANFPRRMFLPLAALRQGCEAEPG